MFDAAYESLLADHMLEQKGDRVRPADRPWSPPAETLAKLEALERDLAAAGYQVPETPQWQAKLGADAPEVASLGFFLGRLVRVSQDLTYSAAQLDELRRRLAAWFEKKPAMTVADFRELSGASRKYAVPLLEHSDRIGWTMRVGDERRAGAKLRG